MAYSATPRTPAAVGQRRRLSAAKRNRDEGKRFKYYREVHLLADLGWVDLDFGCYTIYTSSSDKLPFAQDE